MSLLKSKYKSTLSATKKTALLKKIRLLAAVKKRRMVVKRNNHIFKGQFLTSFSIVEGNTNACLVINAGNRYGVVAGALTNQGLTYTAKKVGDWYANDVRIQLINPGSASALSVLVVDHDIIVTLAHNGSAVTSTANDVSAAIAASAAANALVAMSGSGATPLAALAITGLSGGSNTQSYDKADIVRIRRLRTKKYMIVLKDSSNPA